ncbi:MAG: hypothetical protein ACJ8C6_00925, partial [Microvirga sp.]
MRPLICLVTSVALVPFLVLTAHAIETPPTTPVPAQPTTLESFVPTPPVPGDLDHLPGIFKA